MPEVELKLAATTSDMLLVKQALLGMAGRERAARTTLTSTYYDTADGKLQRQGLTLRVRKENRRYVQTVKTAEAAGVPFARGEWEDVITGDRPDLRARNSGAHLPGALGDADLHPLFTTVVRRAIVKLEPDDSTEIEGALDEGEIQAAGTGRAEPICEVELEHKRGDPAAIYEIALRLIEVAPLRIEIRSKAERGCRLLDGAVDAPQAVHPPAVQLDAGMTVEEVLQKFGRECLEIVLRNEPGALSGVPDALHQMRVALRRLRAALAAVKRMLPAEQYERVDQELKWLANILGPARNWDVLSSGILAPVKSALLSRQEFDALLGVAEQERRLAHERAEAAIRSRRYTAALLKLSQWLAASGWRDQRVSQQSALLMAPIGVVAPTLLARRHKKVGKAIEGFADLTLKQRHRVRIAVKKLRYSIELLESLFARDKVAGFARRVKPLQDGLGHANDVSVASQLLANLPVPDKSAVVDRAAGIVLGWHDRGLVDHERKLLKQLHRFRRARPFW